VGELVSRSTTSAKAEKRAPAKKTPAKKTPAKKAAAHKAPGKKSPAHKATSKQAGKKAPGKKATPKKVPPKKVPPHTADAHRPHKKAKRQQARRAPQKEVLTRRRVGPPRDATRATRHRRNRQWDCPNCRHRPRIHWQCSASKSRYTWRSCGAGDLGVSIVVGTLSIERIDSAARLSAALRVLRLCGLQALDQRQQDNLQLLLSRSTKLAERAESVKDVAEFVCELTAYACRYGPKFALAGCKVLEQLCRSDPAPGAAALSGLGYFWQVGAAAVAVGATSTATYVADIAHRRDLAATIALISKETKYLDQYSLRSNLFGGYLGDRPRDALATYGEFLSRYVEWRSSTPAPQG
jgi:hypothetical protein